VWPPRPEVTPPALLAGIQPALLLEIQPAQRLRDEDFLRPVPRILSAVD
jgi:hypothetical protein